MTWLRFDTPGKVGGYPMQRDDVVVLQAAGGGGYGDPLRRPVEAVSEDVREGYITAEWAREHYGVVLNVDLTPDTDATAALRVELAAGPDLFQGLRHGCGPLRSWPCQQAA